MKETIGKEKWQMPAVIALMLLIFAIAIRAEWAYIRLMKMKQLYATVIISFLIFALTTPLHERLHGLMLKRAGCENVEYLRLSLKHKVYTPCCRAEGFLLRKREAITALLCPLVVIGTVLLILGLCFANHSVIRTCFMFMFAYNVMGALGDIFNSLILVIRYRKQDVLIETVGTYLVVHNAEGEMSKCLEV